MEIKNVFNDEEKELRNIIKNIAPVNCIQKFFNYLDCSEDIEGLEMEFLGKLQEHCNNFLSTIFILKLNKMTKKDLVEKILDNFEEGTASYDDLDYENLTWHVSQYYTDDEFYPLLQQEMTNVLNNLLAEKKKSNKDKKIEETKKAIESCSKEINTYSDKIECYKKTLIDLNNMLKDLES